MHFTLEVRGDPMAEGPMEEAYMRSLSGEMDAFEIIVKELQMPLIHFINRYIGNTSIAEDLAEDVFVEILLHRDRTTSRSS